MRFATAALFALAGCVFDRSGPPAVVRPAGQQVPDVNTAPDRSVDAPRSDVTPVDVVPDVALLDVAPDVTPYSCSNSYLYDGICTCQK